jgi:hypothetical protein
MVAKNPSFPEGATVMTSINVAAIARPAPDQLRAYDADDMRAIASGLAAHGLTTHLTDARAGLDVTAVQSPSGKREAELIIDEDGYAELRYWNLAGTPPEQVVATALRALEVVSAR